MGENQSGFARRVRRNAGWLRPTAVALATAVVLVAVVGCGGSSGTTVESSSTSGAKTTQTSPPPSASDSSSAEAVFQANCSSCHKLAAAEATFGTYGPDLDQLKPTAATVEAQVVSGGGIMPAFGKSEILTKPEIEAVSEYVAAEAGK